MNNQLMAYLESYKHAFNQSTQLEGGVPSFASAAAPRGSATAMESRAKAQNFIESIDKSNPDIAKALTGIPQGRLREQAAIQMMNWKRAVKHAKNFLGESTLSSELANFDKFAFDIIRAILPELASERLWSIQSMFGPTSQVFYFDYVHGSTRGNVVAGQKLFENHDPNYGAGQVDIDVIATGTGGAAYTFNLTYTPVTPGTFNMTDGTQYVSDDGNGNLVGDIAAGTNTINYNTGAINVTFAANVASGTPIEGSWQISNEGNENGVPEIDLVLTSAPVIARTYKLRTRFSMEAQFSLKATMGLEAEAEATTAMGAEIAFAIDSHNMDNVKRVALDKRNDPQYVFDMTAPNGTPFKFHKENIVDYFIKGSSFILSQSGRAIGNKVICGSQVCNVVESLVPRFQPANIRAARGIHFMGVLDGRWEIFKDLRMDDFEFMLIFKGNEFLFAGYVFAPWILAFTTPTVTLDDFQARKGMGSLYGQKVINNKYFLRMKTIKSGATFQS